VTTVHRYRTRWIALIVALGVPAAAVGVALAATGGSSRSHPTLSPSRAAVATHHAVAARSHSLKTRHARASVRAVSPTETSASDTDNVQVGDQSGAEDAGTAEATSEATPGDAAVDGVEQAPGADHQCPPDCAPGEKP
jgi:hypothetical protein